MKANALLVNWATLAILLQIVSLILSFIAFPPIPSMQVSSLIKAALTQVCIFLIFISKSGPCRSFIAAFDWWSSSTESLMVSKQSATAIASPGSLDNFKARFEVYCAPFRLTDKAALASSLGLVWMVLA